MKAFVPWDGVKPLFDDASERSIMDQSALKQYLAEQKHDGLGLAQIELEICENEMGPKFCITEFLEDYIHEEFDWRSDAVAEINAQVNAWIDLHGPYSRQRPTRN